MTNHIIFLCDNLHYYFFRALALKIGINISAALEPYESILHFDLSKQKAELKKISAAKETMKNWYVQSSDDEDDNDCIIVEPWQVINFINKDVFIFI